MPNVIIDFTIRETGGADALDTLDAAANAQNEAAANARKANAAFAEQQKIIDQDASAFDKLNKGMKALPKELAQQAIRELEELRKRAQAGNSSLRDLATVIKLARAQLNQLQPGTKAFADLEAEINATEIATSRLNKTFTTSRQELTQMREALREMEAAGLDGTQVFKDLALQAAEIEDSAGDAQARIKALASDTLELDVAIGVVQGVTGAFAALQGVAALAGDENEDLQRTLLKVNAAMSILQGLQSIQNTLQRQSILVIATENALRRISAASTALQTAAESRYIVVRWAAVAAQRALNLVMAANPATLLLVAIGAVAAALVFFTSRTDEAAEAQERLNREMERTRESAEFQAGLLDRMAQNRQREIALLRAQGAAASRVATAEIAALRERLRQEMELQAALKNRSGAEDEYSASLLRAVEIRSEIRIKELERTKAFLQEEREVRDRFLKDQVAANDAAVIAAAAGFRRLDAEIQAIQARLRQTLANPDLTNNERVLAELEAGEAIRNAREKLIGDLETLQRNYGAVVTALNEETISAGAQAAQRELQIQQQKNAAILANTQARIEAEKIAQQRATDFLFQSTLNIASSLSQVVQNSTQQQLDTLQKQLDQGIISQEQFDARSRAIRRRSAQAEKNYSLFSAILQQSLAVLKVLSDQSIPVLLRPLYIAATIAQTAAQIAAIQSAPLPAYWKGTQHAAGGWSWVAERGGELIYNRGKWQYQDKPAIMNLDKGAKVLPAWDTQKVLNMYSFKTADTTPVGNSVTKLSIDYEKLGRAVGKEIRNLPLQVHNWDNAGYSNYQTNLAQRQSVIKNRYSTT